MPSGAMEVVSGSADCKDAVNSTAGVCVLKPGRGKHVVARLWPTRRFYRMLLIKNHD